MAPSFLKFKTSDVSLTQSMCDSASTRGNVHGGGWLPKASWVVASLCVTVGGHYVTALAGEVTYLENNYCRGRITLKVCGENKNKSS